MPNPRRTGIYVGPSIISGSAIASIIPSSGTSNATGQITHTTALAAQPTGTVLVYLPAGVVTAGSQGTGAALYAAIYSSTTVCQLTGTGIVTANAAYTQVVTEQILATDTIPGGSMGLNGGVHCHSFWTIPNNANTKTLRKRFGGIGGTQYLNAALTASTGLERITKLRNRGAANAQFGGSAALFSLDNSGNTGVTSSVDTTASVDLVYTGQLGVATDYLILESRETWLMP